MKTQSVCSSFIRIISIILCVAGVVGCKQDPTFKTTSAAGEVTPNDPVTVEGRTAGYVCTINPSGEVEFVITNRFLAQTLRQGTVHVRERGRIVLDTSGADPAGALLRSGDVVPTQSKAAHFARQWSKSAALLIGLAVIVLAISVIKLLVLKTAGPLLPFVAAVLLAGFTAWILSSPLVPVIDRCYSTLAPQPDSSSALQSADPSAGALARWQARVVGVLGTRPNPHLISFVLIGVVALPLWLCFVCRLRRVSRSGGPVLMLTMLLLSATAVSAEGSGTTFTRDYLLQEQTQAGRLISDSEQACAKVSRLVEAGLAREAASDLVQINFNLDRAEVALRGHTDRVKDLKPSALRYIASEEKRRLGESFNVLNERLITCQSHASTLHQRLIKVNEKEALPLQLYLAQRSRYTQRIQLEDLVDAKAVLGEVNQLARFGLPVVRAGLVTSENVTACRLNDNGNITLPNGLVVSADGKAVPITAVVTNTVTNVVRITTPAPPPVTNKVVEYITNTQQVVVHRTNVVVVVSNSPPPMAAVSLPASTNLTDSASIQDAVTNIPASVGGADPGVAGPTSDADGGRKPPVSSPDTAASHPFGWTQARWLIAVVAVVGLLALAFGRRLMTAEPLEISLLVNGREQAFCLAAGEALFLGREAFSDLAKATHLAYRLTPKKSTLVLRPPASATPAEMSIRVNQADTTLPRLLVPEDEILIITDREELVVKFLNCAAPVSGVDEALQDAPAN